MYFSGLTFTYDFEAVLPSDMTSVTRNQYEGVVGDEIRIDVQTQDFFTASEIRLLAR